MTPRAELEIAIQQLPEDEIRQLATWLQAYVDDLWDRKMEDDLNQGKLDHLIAQAEASIETNQVRSLNEVLHNS
ncbi:MAG: hypothetical protein F6K16_36900 [Symploca sp. SIO2B6]|nr:hypothetical protein [Symploca sp. SIO2B6]